MSYLADAKRLAAAVHAGELTDEQAAQRLVEFANGGLTLFGAADTIRYSHLDTLASIEQAIAAARVAGNDWEADWLTLRLPTHGVLAESRQAGVYLP